MGWLDSLSTGTPYAGYFNNNTYVGGRLIVTDTIIAFRGMRVSGARSTFNDSVRINSNLFVNGTLSRRQVLLELITRKILKISIWFTLL